MAGDPKELLKAKYERNGWPSQKRPDAKPASGWSFPLLASVTRPRAHVVSPDGTQIAFYWNVNDASDLYVIPATGGWPSRLTFDRQLTAYWADEPPQWSPDGQWLAYTDQDHVWVIPAGGGKPEKVTRFSEAGGTPRWLPDSDRLVVSIGLEDRLRILLTDRQGDWPQALTSGPGHDHSPSISPDGRRMLYVHQHLDDLNRSDIMLLDIQSGECQVLTGAPGFQDKNAHWSPDGQIAAFVSERPGFNELFTIDVATGQERQLTQSKQDIVEFAWSPDGAHILCVINREGAFDLALVNFDTGERTDLHTAYGIHANPHWLPNGKAVTFEFEDVQNPHDIYRMELQSKVVTQLTFSKPPILNNLDQVVPERITYKSFDNLDIPAVLYRPESPNGAAIVYPHGGPTSQYVLEWDVIAQYFVSKGYAWIAPNFRGSTGYGIDFERANYGVWGVDDTKDCLAAADYLAALDWIDSRRIAIFGASYGSYMAVCALAYDPNYRFACGVAKYGDCNILSSWAQGDRIGREDIERMMKHPSSSQYRYKAGSPVWKVADIQRPLLITHGLLDDRVHPLQSEELVEALKRYDKVFEYVTYADEGHGFLRRATMMDFYARLERFLDWYLL